jgi:hypothetical protein
MLGELLRPFAEECPRPIDRPLFEDSRDALKATNLFISLDIKPFNDLARGFPGATIIRRHAFTTSADYAFRLRSWLERTRSTDPPCVLRRGSLVAMGLHRLRYPGRRESPKGV